MPRLTIQPATDGEIPAYLRIRDAAAGQLVADGIVQWQPGELTVDSLLAWLGGGQLFTAKIEGELVGGLMLMWSDAHFWGDRDVGSAGYTHGLLIDRRLKGYGLGRQLLEFSEGRIRDSGRPLARLDTATSNVVLRRYYRDVGYTEVGERVFEGAKVHENGAPVGSVTLFEKKLSG